MKLLKITTYGKMDVVECEEENFIDTCYREIGCDCIEFPQCVNLPRHLQMICDESGWLRDGPKFINVVGSWLHSGLYPDYLVAGTIMIARHGLNSQGEEDLIGLTDEDIKFVKEIVLK